MSWSHLTDKRLQCVGIQEYRCNIRLVISCNEGSKLVKEFFCVDLLYLLLQNQSFPVEIVDDCFFSDSGGQ